MTTTESGAPTRVHTARWLLAILTLAIVLRLIRLGTFSYWHDEVHNLLASEDLYSTVFQGKMISNHPPLAYILVAVWRALGLGYSEWTMRLLPATFGVAGVGAIFLFARRLFGSRTALIAAFLLATAPLHVTHSQDLKEYIYLPFVVCFIGIFLHRAVETNRWGDWLAYGLFAGLGCYTEIFVGPLLVGLNLWAIVLLRKKSGGWTRWIVGNVLGAALFLPWLGIMIRKADVTMIKATTWWIPKPGLTEVIYYLKAVAIGYTTPPLYKVALVVFVLLAVSGMIIAIRRSPREGWLLVAWFTIPVGIVFAISQVTESIFLIRALMPYALVLYIAVAVAIAAIPGTAARYGVLFLVGAFSAIGLVYHYLRIYTPSEFPNRPAIHAPRDYEIAAESVADRWQEGDVIVHGDASTWLPFFWYGLRDKPQYTAAVSQDYIHDIAIGNPKNTDDPALKTYFPREVQDITRGARRVWFVFSAWERLYLEGNMTDVWAWLDSHFTEVDRKSFAGIDLVLYERTVDAPVMQRDNDDGVSADLLIGGQPHIYHKVRLDNGLIPRRESERRGDLTLAFDEQEVSHATRFTKTGFTITNRSTEQRTVEITAIASDILFKAASLYETEATDEVWHVYFRHNPQPPPPNYKIPVASAHFPEPGSSTLVGELPCPGGTYATWLYLMGAPGDTRYGRSDLTVLFDNQDVTAPITVPKDESLRWTWFEGAPITMIGSPVPVRMTATCPPGREPAYADVGYIALQRENSGASLNEPVTMSRVLEPGEEWEHTVELQQAAPRVDVWVYEHATNGKAYHIFRTLDVPEALTPAPSN